jgi:aryl-alcohol dehydrogenase-like predicted oxidoreductase
LKRLGTDYIDVYVYHVPPKNEWIEPAREILEDLRTRGMIRAYGISTNNIHSLRALAERNAVQVVQFAQSMLSHQPELIELVAERNLGVVVRGAFAGGKLSGKYFDAPPEFGPDDGRRNWIKPDDFAKCRPFRELVPEGWTMPQFALRYLLDFPTTHVIIMGAKRTGEYDDAVRAVDLPRLDPDTRATVHALRAKIA